VKINLPTIFFGYGYAI